MTEVRTHRLRPDQSEVAVKRALSRRFGFLVALCVAVLIAMGAKQILVDHETPAELALPFGGSVLLIAPIFALAFRRGIVQARVASASYSLAVGIDSLRRIHAHVPPMEIARAEVTRVVEDEHAGLTILTATSDRLIQVPRALEDYDDVRERLLTWGSSEASAPPRGIWAARVRTLMLLTFWFGTGVVPDIRVAMGLGAILLLLVGWSLRETLRSPLVGGPLRWSMIVIHGFMIIAPFARLGSYLMWNRLAAP